MANSTEELVVIFLGIEQRSGVDTKFETPAEGSKDPREIQKRNFKD